MTRRQSLLGAFTGLTAAVTNAADLRQKDPTRLQAAAISIVSSRNAANLSELARQLATAEFLRRLDPEPDSLTRLAEVFQALEANPSPATAALCLKVAKSSAFAALPARWNHLLSALAAVRPMSTESGRLFLEKGRTGFLEVAVPLLAANASPSALQAMEALMKDETQSPEQQIEAAHWGILPNRLRPGVAEACGRILATAQVAPAVKVAIAESLFDNRPAEWFGKQSPYPVPPAWTKATPAVRKAYVEAAGTARSLPHLPDRLTTAIDLTMRQLSK